jgi:hypothetical protein
VLLACSLSLLVARSARTALLESTSGIAAKQIASNALLARFKNKRAKRVAQIAA